MSVAIVTGSAGLIGSETARFLNARGLEIVGIDNDMRSLFFGAEASTAWNRRRLEAELPGYRHYHLDIRDGAAIDRVFARYGRAVAAVVHTAAQPSHDWAARDPRTDFTINANGTMELLEATRRHCPEAPFVFTSTNKVYGDRPNRLPLVELDMRWELDSSHPFAAHGIDESMSLDRCTHSIFGASKVAADLMVQEYARCYGLKTACFRGGCLTGPNHSATHLHGFLAYLALCGVTGAPYVVHGYEGKQVRDNIHAYDLVSALWAFIERPRAGEVYNLGGGRHASCSVREAIELCERILGHPMKWSYDAQNRVGDHIWWISDVRKFQSHYPHWNYRYDLCTTLTEIIEGIRGRNGGDPMHASRSSVPGS
jgi:CDP-paratose 2-epimerase